MIAAAPYDSVDSTIISSPFIIPVVLKPPPSTAPKYSYAMDAANQSANAAPEVAFSDAGLEPVTQIDRSQKFTTLYPPTSTPYYEGNNNIGQYNGAKQESKQQRICGLTPKLFWILIVFMAVIIAAAIGGGVGGGLASQKKNSSSPTPTGSSAASSSPSSSTSSTTASNTASPLLNSGCNGTDNTFYSPSNAADDSSPFTINNKTLSYRILCYTNIPDKKSFNNPQITTLGQLQNLQSLQECITACATMNYAIKNALGGDSASVPFESLCSGVVYSYQDYTAGKPINCDLNSGVRMNASRVSWTDGRGPETHTQVDSAVLDLGD